jgi:hypothetical protein
MQNFIMSGEFTNDNIDKIFKDYINDMEIQPSENFWMDISEDVLSKATCNSRYCY